MKNLFLTFLSSFLLTVAFSQSTHFRNVEWGASIETVKEKEKAHFISEKRKTLEYRSVLGDYNADLQYLFSIEGKLMKAKYIIENYSLNPKKYLEEYDFFSQLLTEKYGKPIKKVTISSKEVSPDESHTIILLKEGNYSQEMIWETPDTYIHLILSGNAETGLLNIEYSSKKYLNLSKQQKREMVLKDL